MTTPRGSRIVRVANPLSTIAVFLAFTEVTSGIAATVTEAGIQVAFTAFSLAFPLLVASGFGVFLWKKPEVLYAPGDFPKETPIHAYVEAVRSGGIQASIEAQNKALREIVVSAVESTIVRYRPDSVGTSVGGDVGDLARTVAEEEFSRRTVVIDLPATVDGENTFVMPVAASTSVDQVLDTVYFAMQGAVRPYTYGVDWVLVDPDTGRWLSDIGTAFAKKVLRTGRDERVLGEAGIEPGAHLAVHLIGTAR